MGFNSEFKGLKVTGSRLLTSPYAFMACTETNLSFTFLFQVLFVAFEDSLAEMFLGGWV